MISDLFLEIREITKSFLKNKKRELKFPALKLYFPGKLYLIRSILFVCEKLSASIL